ncbi:hypothetical protein ID866_10112 [Astraeus odoratus]|nr:hypothetical protein ID866_10112 [Astraeus odoratus]
MTKVWSGPALLLTRPIGLSLPNNRHVVLLLKALSVRLAGRCLVTRVIQCSASRVTNPSTPQLDGKSSMGNGRCSDLYFRWVVDPLSYSYFSSVEPHSTTPLYTLAQPQFWSRNETADIETMALFKEVWCFMFYVTR